MMLVTLEQAKSHLRVDFDDEDDYIELLVQSASGAVVNYLEEYAYSTFLDSSGEPMYDSSGRAEFVPYEVTAAVLILVGYLYRMRDNNEGGEFDRGYLPMPVTALLYPLRKPALA